MFKKMMVSGVMFASLPLSVAAAESGFSGEVLFGASDQELSVSGESTSGNDTSFGVRGSFLVNENFAVEAAYQNYGETDDTYIDEFGDTINDKLSSTALTIGVKGVLPLNNDVSLNGRLGMSFWSAEIKETDSFFPGETFKSDDDGNDLYYGIGVQYDMDSNIFIGLEYTITKMDASFEGTSVDFDVNNIGLSLGFKF